MNMFKNSDSFMSSIEFEFSPYMNAINCPNQSKINKIHTIDIIAKYTTPYFKQKLKKVLDIHWTNDFKFTSRLKTKIKQTTKYQENITHLIVLNLAHVGQC